MSLKFLFFLVVGFITFFQAVFFYQLLVSDIFLSLVCFFMLFVVFSYVLFKFFFLLRVGIISFSGIFL